MSQQMREFPLSDRNFREIQDVAYRLTGINLSDHKKNMIYGRLARRIRQLGLSSFDDYCKILSDSCEAELPEFINAITTNLTSFFRENHHFQFLSETVLPELVKKNSGSKRIRIWSAGCSTGEEPYSIAMCVKESLPVNGWDIKILATDLDTNVVSHAKDGVYRSDRISGIGESRQRRWFLHSPNDPESVKVKPELTNLITFKTLNLMSGWPMKGPFDVIFCRNVVIYFDKDTQRVLFDRYADILAPGGYLFIGHSENIHNVSGRFSSLGKTMYQKIR